MLTLRYPSKDNKTIHVIGDSHSCFFYGSDTCEAYFPDQFPLAKPGSLIPGFKVYHVGPALAYKLCEMNTTVQGRETIFYLLDNVIGAGSRVLLAFGEIDCRYHLFKAAEKYNGSVEQVMEECIRRYISVAKEIKARGYDVMIWGVVASRPDVTEIDDLALRWATCAERNILTRQFNDRLEYLLAEESIKFASIFEQLVDYANETKEELYLADNVHLSQKIMPAAIKAIERAYSGKRETIKI